MRHPSEAGQSIVSVELQGGLGNQMFQYAAGHALARRTGAELRLDLSYFARFDKRRYLLDCYAVPASIWGKPALGVQGGLAPRLASGGWRRLGMPNRFLYRGCDLYTQPGFHFDPAFETLIPPVHLSGYFQSELYFRGFADEVRKLFTIRVPLSSGFAAQRDLIMAADWPVSIHVRRGDYVSDPKAREVHGLCDGDYYRRAIELAARLGQTSPRYFVFGDDMVRARELLHDLKDAVYQSGDVERPWEDLALMSACRGHIIANSSFSWWGAWLDQRVDKWVIAPRQWFTPAYQRTVSMTDLPGAGWISL